MRVIKTKAKRLELAALGQLFYIADGCYVKAAIADVETLNVKFYARTK